MASRKNVSKSAKKSSTKKKSTKKTNNKKRTTNNEDFISEFKKSLPPGTEIGDEALQKLERIKKLLDKFKEKVVAKFEDHCMGIALLPPEKDDANKEKINILVLMDDTDSTKMTKEELQEKLQAIISSQAKEIDENLSPNVVLLTQVWSSCYDGKYEILQTIALAAPIYDKGMLAAIKIAEIHKKMVLDKFEKYIVSYVLAGSLVQGRATPESDIDVFIVIDDTDVKKMTRAELKDKLRAIIIGMGIEAGNITGIQNKLNIQVYILTDFWDNIKEANPVIFTFLRDGIPFYDRGIFMPWKHLLQMGRVKPSKEAIDMYKSSGEQMLTRIQSKINEIAMEDLFWATITPSQAAIMLYGLPPPTPKETPEVLHDVFVKKEKLLEAEYPKIMAKILKVRKDMEHGVKKNVSGTELDELIKGAKKYIERLNKLFNQISELKEKESILHIYENTVTIVRDILKLEGIERVKDETMLKLFEEEVIEKGLIPERYLRILKEIEKGKKEFDKGKLGLADAHKIRKNSSELLKFMVEYVQRKRGREIEKAKIRVKHGDKYGEIILLGDEAFVIHDLDNEEKEITKAKITPEGGLADMKESSLEELEKAMINMKIPNKAFIKEKIFEDLKSVFGKDVEILINY